MPVINPIDKILLPINDKFSVATERANASKAVKYGDAKYTKAEGRAQFMRELASKTVSYTHLTLPTKRIV